MASQPAFSLLDPFSKTPATTPSPSRIRTAVPRNSPSIESPESIDGLQRQQALEERAIAAERNAQIFGRDLVAFAPLPFERCALVAEHLRQPVHHQRHQRVGLLDGLSRLVDETGLDRIPLRAIARGLGAGEHRHRAVVGGGTLIGAAHVGMPRAGHLAGVDVPTVVEMRMIAVVHLTLALTIVDTTVVTRPRLAGSGRSHRPRDVGSVSVVAHDALLTSLRLAPTSSSKSARK